MTELRQIWTAERMDALKRSVEEARVDVKDAKQEVERATQSLKQAEEGYDVKRQRYLRLRDELESLEEVARG